VHCTRILESVIYRVATTAQRHEEYPSSVDKSTLRKTVFNRRSRDGHVAGEDDLHVASRLNILWHQAWCIPSRIETTVVADYSITASTSDVHGLTSSASTVDRRVLL